MFTIFELNIIRDALTSQKKLDRTVDEKIKQRVISRVGDILEDDYQHHLAWSNNDPLPQMWLSMHRRR